MSVTAEKRVELTRPARRRRPWTADVVLMVALALGLLLAPVYLQNDYQLRILVLICIYSAAATGWNLLGGFANQISLGHAVFFGVGAYAVVILQSERGLSPWLAMPVGVAVSLLVALLIGWPTFRLSGHYFALGTLALLQIFDIVARYWKGLTGGPVGITLPILPSSLANLQFDRAGPYLYVAAALLILALAIARIVRYSRLGLRLDCIRLNPQAASLAGVNLFRTKLSALLISAAVVSLAGSMYAAFQGFLDPDTAFSFNTSINMALFAIIGGVSFWWGPLLGALILVPLAQVASSQLPGNLAALGPFSYGLLLIALVILQPRGIAGWLNRLWCRVLPST